MNRKLILAQRGTKNQVFAWIAKLARTAPQLTLGGISQLQKLNISSWNELTICPANAYQIVESSRA